MKVSHYGILHPSGRQKQSTVIARGKDTIGYRPLIYLQRPKWIEDDAVWRKIVSSVKVKLQKDFDVK